MQQFTRSAGIVNSFLHSERTTAVASGVVEEEREDSHALTEGERQARAHVRAIMQMAKDRAPAGSAGERYWAKGTAQALIELLHSGGIRSGRGSDGRYSEGAVSSWTRQEHPSPPGADVLLAAALGTGIRVDEVLYGASLADRIAALEAGQREVLAELRSLRPQP